MDDGRDYDDFLEVEKLETLLEDLEEAGMADNLNSFDIDGDLRERLDDAHIASVEDLRARIARLHSLLDTKDDES